jgi:hypothetical protein
MATMTSRLHLFQRTAVTYTGCEIVSTGKPTYWPTDPKKKLPDLIDFFLAKNISTNYIKIEEGFDLNSDHSPIYLTISDKIRKIKTQY